MPIFKLPLSGDVAQTINPWTAVFRPAFGPFGVVNINLGQSSEPRIEADVLSDVASYGRQLGRIGDALAVLLAHFEPKRPLTPDEQKALDDLKRMLDDIARVKERHGRGAPRAQREP